MSVMVDCELMFEGDCELKFYIVFSNRFCFGFDFFYVIFREIVKIK